MNDRKQAPPKIAKQVGIRLPARLNERIEAIAKAESNNVSSVVRRLLTVALGKDVV